LDLSVLLELPNDEATKKMNKARDRLDKRNVRSFVAGYGGS